MLFQSGCTDLGRGVIQGLFPATPVDFEGSSRRCLEASGFCEGNVARGRASVVCVFQAGGVEGLPIRSSVPAV